MGHFALLDPDPDPQPCQKARSCCYLAQLLDPDPDPARKREKAALYLAELHLLDHELDLLEGEAVLLDPDPDPLT